MTLIFLSLSDQSPLLENVPENSEGEWTIRLAQHLLSKLSVHKSYVICAYKGCKFGSTCPCPKHDDLVGFSGDTSFGMYSLAQLHNMHR